MTSVWRRHLIVCSGLGLLAVPIYFVDQALFAPAGTGNWINLDFRGLLFWSYVTWFGIYVVASALALLWFTRARKVSFQLGLMAFSFVLLVTGCFVYGKVSAWSAREQERVVMERRRALRNVIELKEWQYDPDDVSPTQIRVSVIVHDSGRFAGNVSGGQTDSSGSTTPVFESSNEPQDQRQVNKEDSFTYVFPLKILHEGRADDVSIALYLFKAKSGPATGDIAKIFSNSPHPDDDGQFFYAALPPPSRPAK